METLAYFIGILRDDIKEKNEKINLESSCVEVPDCERQFMEAIEVTSDDSNLIWFRIITCCVQVSRPWEVIFVSHVDGSLTLVDIKIECSKIDGFMESALDIISVSARGKICRFRSSTETSKDRLWRRRATSDDSGLSASSSFRAIQWYLTSLVVVWSMEALAYFIGVTTPVYKVMI